MKLLSEIQGDHLPLDGEGLTLEDLYQLIKSIPRKVRENSYVGSHGNEVTGLQFGHRSTAEKYEFSVAIVTDDKNYPEEK